MEAHQNQEKRPIIQIKVHYRARFLNWSPPPLEKKQIHDWNAHYKELKTAIVHRFSDLKTSKYDIHDEDQCDVGDGCDLRTLYDESNDIHLYIVPKVKDVEC